jgi:NADPH2:quinone reductase
MCVPADAVYLLPDTVSSVDAVTLGNYQLAGALLYASGIQRPSSVLIHGAAGGVGTAVLQLAEADGLLAIGTVSSDEKYAYAQAAGARHLIHRGHQSVQTEVMALTAGRGVDLVLDHVAGPGFNAQLDLLAPLGTLLSYNALGGLPPDNLLGDMRRLLGKSLGVRCYSIHTLDQAPAQRRALMERAISLMASGALRPPPSTRLTLSDARQAHTLLDAGQTLGKLVLLPQR